MLWLSCFLFFLHEFGLLPTHNDTIDTHIEIQTYTQIRVKKKLIFFVGNNCIYYGAEEDKNCGGGTRGITSRRGAE